ncbi:MAG: Rv2175c family DNA-binding protein [Mycobacteriaceae bacterium]|uniref:Rv2175c family DNA-binding protein n=1 Tax=Corynebacterium sp. TaxID=1720 RepID=UPI003F9A92E4
MSTNESTAKILSEAVSGVPAGEPVLNVPDVAELLGVIVTRVMDDLGQHRLIAVEVDGIRHIPARFFTDGGEINKFVPGLIALLSDGGYSDEEILDFLFTADESLPGRPVDALHGHLAREVMRRAQAMAII